MEILKKLKYKETHNSIFLKNDKDNIFKELKNTNNDDKYFFGLLFIENEKELLKYLPQALEKFVDDDIILWLIYPKKSSKKYKSDLNRDILFEKLKKYELLGVAMVSLNDDWSAFRVRREKYFNK